MVLNKKNLLTICVCILTFFCSAQENTYWQTLFSTAFENSENVFQLKQEYISVLISKKQYDYQWFPSLQVSLQETTSFTNGSGIQIINQSQSTELTKILTPFVNFSINQKLPGQGSLNLSAGYGFNYLPEKNAFLQFPEISFSYNQYLGRGAFGICGNIENKLINEQMHYSQLMFRKNLNSQLQEVINLLKQIDLIEAEQNYYEALVKEYESIVKAAEKKEKAGMQSSLESHYAQHQFNEANNTLNEIQNNKKQLLNELKILYPDFNQEELDKERAALRQIINDIYVNIKSDDNSLYSNLDNTLYESIQRQYVLQFQNSENNYAPVLVVSSSLGTNEYINTSYADWYKSFRVLKELENPFNFTISIGLQKNFEIPQARKLRKEIYELNQNSLESQIKFYRETKRKELLVLIKQIHSDNTYINKLEKELPTEREFRKKRKKLYEQNILTQEEFLKSETQYFLIMKEYIQTFWDIINNQISVINLCSDEKMLINKFLGENYEKNF